MCKACRYKPNSGHLLSKFLLISIGLDDNILTHIKAILSEFSEADSNKCLKKIFKHWSRWNPQIWFYSKKSVSLKIDYLFSRSWFVFQVNISGIVFQLIQTLIPCSHVYSGDTKPREFWAKELVDNIKETIASDIAKQ